MSQLNHLKSPIFVADEKAMEAFGARIATSVKSGSVIFLKGELGAGKTTFVRGFLRGLGYKGVVKSPTYTLVEEYEIEHKKIYHFDLYRISDPESLEFIGIREYFHHDAISLIEWPDQGTGFLPLPDMSLDFEILEEGRLVSFGYRR